MTGASGRIGQMLRQIWADAPPPFTPIYAQRTAGLDLTWDIVADPAPSWPPQALVLHLADILRGSTAVLAQNATMVPPLLAACRANTAKHLFFVSSAAVYAPSNRPAAEADLPDPATAYGCAKYQAEALLPPSTAAMGVTILRLGNVIGADALLSRRQPGERIALETGAQPGQGPMRSWIGPAGLAKVLAHLFSRAAAGVTLPHILNVACAPPLDMAALLHLTQQDWGWSGTAARISVAVQDCRLLQSLCPLPPTSAAQMISEWRGYHSRGA